MKKVIVLTHEQRIIARIVATVTALALLTFIIMDVVTNPSILLN